MGNRIDEQYPALQARRGEPIDYHVDQARRRLWRAFQDGSLTEDELAITLDRLDACDPLPRKEQDLPEQQQRS